MLGFDGLPCDGGEIKPAPRFFVLRPSARVYSHGLSGLDDGRIRGFIHEEEATWYDGRALPGVFGVGERTVG